MSNGTEVTYERAFKLLTQLGKLILDGKRSIVAVCVVLQRLVFEKTKWPQHKNWQAIQAMPDQFPGQSRNTKRVMTVTLATLNLQSYDAGVESIVAAFPECFTDKKSPVPWTLVCLVADEFAQRTGQTPHSGRGQVGHYGALEAMGIRSHQFWPKERIPQDVLHSTVGTSITWREAEWFVAEKSSATAYIVPAGCIDFKA